MPNEPTRSATTSVGSITEIAVLFGFAAASGFARAFRRATRSAPTTWPHAVRRAGATS